MFVLAWELVLYADCILEDTVILEDTGSDVPMPPDMSSGGLLVS